MGKVKRDAIRGLRVIALFEASKGALVIAAGFSLFAFIHLDAQRYAEELVAHLHLNPAKHHPGIFSQLTSGLTDARLRFMGMLAAIYSAMRFIEAYGLWYGKSWAEWFALLSGAVYLPIELYELAKGFSWIKIGFVLVNLFVVLYLVAALDASRRRRREHGGTEQDERIVGRGPKIEGRKTVPVRSGGASDEFPVDRQR
jgi:uncharacterized membrane protein (DUF2068 family)